MSAYDDIVDLARRQIDDLASQFPPYVSEAKLKLDALQGQQREPLAAVAREGVSAAVAFSHAGAMTQALPKNLPKLLGLGDRARVEELFDVVLLIYPRKERP